MYDVITCPCPWYLLLAQKSTHPSGTKYNIYYLHMEKCVINWELKFQKLPDLQLVSDFDSIVYRTASLVCPQYDPVTCVVLLVTKFRLTCIVTMAWINNYIHIKQWDVIIHSFPNLKGCFAKLPLKLGHRWLISSYNKLWMKVLIPALIVITSLRWGDSYMRHQSR